VFAPHARPFDRPTHSERKKATPEQFMKFLREIYNRPEMRERFPHGF
jgi:hypothetical protein